jgi:hypothetical protein
LFQQLALIYKLQAEGANNRKGGNSTLPEFFGGNRTAEADPQVRDYSVIAPLITKLPVQLSDQ